MMLMARIGRVAALVMNGRNAQIVSFAKFGKKDSIKGPADPVRPFGRDEEGADLGESFAK